MSECMNRKEKMGVGGIRGNFYSTKVTNKTCMVLPVDGLRFAKKEKKRYIETLLLLNPLVINECRTGKRPTN